MDLPDRLASCLARVCICPSPSLRCTPVSVCNVKRTSDPTSTSAGTPSRLAARAWLLSSTRLRAQAATLNALHRHSEQLAQSVPAAASSATAARKAVNSRLAHSSSGSWAAHERRTRTDASAAAKAEASYLFDVWGRSRRARGWAERRCWGGCCPLQKFAKIKFIVAKLFSIVFY